MTGLGFLPRPGRPSAVLPRMVIPRLQPSRLKPFAEEPSRWCADNHNCTPAQVMLAWHLQQGRSAIPKSVNPERIAENFDVFDIKLTPVQIAAIEDLDTDERGGPEPEEVTQETFGKDIPEA